MPLFVFKCRYGDGWESFQHFLTHLKIQFHILVDSILWVASSIHINLFKYHGRWSKLTLNYRRLMERYSKSNGVNLLST